MTADLGHADLRRLDAEARREAQRVFDRPFVLEAGAGTGKTAALVSRVMAWSLGPGWERAAARLEAAPGDAARPDRVAARVLSGMVAITFTEAAAAEMARRIDRALSEVERGALPIGVFDDCLPEPAARRERARWLRGALDYLEVHTIHAWCRRLLAAHPLEARMHPSLEVDADGRRQAEIVREVVEAHLREAYTSGDPDLLTLAAHEIGPREIEAELGALLDQGLESGALAADPLAPARVAPLGERVEGALEAAREAGGAPLREGASGKTADVLARIDETLAHLGERPCADRGGLEALAGLAREHWDDSEIERVKKWARASFGVREADLLGERDAGFAAACGELAPLLDHLRALDPDRLDRGRRALVGLLRECEDQLRARGVASFSALLTETARLLSDRPEAAARVRARIDQLLIDEFQDTDRRQCDIVRAVVLDESGRERPGLFLVGDPKQSIYGWRSADLAAYDAFVRDVERAGGVRHRLSVNYRSAPVVLREVERIAAPVMLEREGVQPPFQPLVPCPERAHDPGFAQGERAPVEIWVSAARDPDGGPRARTAVAEAARIEAAALARDLRALHDEHGVAWKRVGVLFRSRGEWDLYLGALREVGVPFAVEGDRSYYQRREVIDASALVRSVLNPDDHLALLGFLRSVAVGVPDAALLPLWRRDFPSRMSHLESLAPALRAELEASVREVAAGLPPSGTGAERVPGWEQNLLAAIDALAELRASYRDDPADVFVERLRTALLLEASEAARFLGPWRAANLDRFFRELAEELCEDGDGHRVWRRLASAVLDEEEAEEATPREIVDDAVQVLTIHGAKGLDFEHVYVMQLHKGSGVRAGDPIPPGAVDGVDEYALFGAPTPAFDRVRSARARLSEAELVRTLYVAVTRAKSRLVLAGLWSDRDPPAAGSHADLLRQRAAGPVDVAALFRQAEREGAVHGDAAGARWVFPALRGEPAPAGPARAAAGAALPSPERVERDSRQLAAARARAAAHQRRRFGGAASGDALPGAAREERAEGRVRARGAGSREAARAVGTAIHRVLEEMDLAAAPAQALARARDTLARELRAGLAPEAGKRALADAAALLEALEAGPLLAKLRGLDACGSVLARELPLLVPPAEEADSPAGFVAGAADLVYRDPDTQELVIADYKTDRVPDGMALAEHAGSYEPQGLAYQRGVREALGLAYTPRFELWYLRRGEIARP